LPLDHVIQVDLTRDVLHYQLNQKALRLAELMDGKLLLVSNAADLTAAEVVERYKSLADIERGFKVLKSEIEIGPVYHRLPERIRARADLLPRVDPASGHAVASAIRQHRAVAGTRTGAAHPYSASPHSHRAG